MIGPFQRSAGAILLVMLVLAGCATPQSRPPKVPRGQAAVEAMKQQDLAARRIIEQNLRLQRVADPIAFAGAPFCGEHVRPAIGIYGFAIGAADRRLQPFLIRNLGMGPRFTVLHVMTGGPAHEAGIRQGDTLLSIGGIDPARLRTARDPAWEQLGKTMNTGKPIAVTFERDGHRREVNIVARPKCSYDWVILPKDEVGAWANGARILVSQGMMDFARSDQHLALVVGHEMAHNAMGHIDAKMQNRLAGSVAGAFFDILAAALGVYTGGAFQDIGEAAGARAFSPDFEREADYVGLYMMARAGWRLDGAADFWRAMGARDEGSIAHTSTHPPTAERFLSIEATAEEIVRKRQSNLALVPEGIDVPAAAEGVQVAAYVSPANQVAGREGGADPLLAVLRPQASDRGAVVAGAAWRGAGATDACGKPWEIALQIGGDKAWGTLTRAGASYDLVGRLDKKSGRIEGRGGKARTSRHKQGPRLVEFELSRQSGALVGLYHMSGAGSPTCITDLRLVAPPPS